jgi:hypothetical protein
MVMLKKKKKKKKEEVILKSASNMRHLVILDEVIQSNSGISTRLNKAS